MSARPRPAGTFLTAHFGDRVNRRRALRLLHRTIMPNATRPSRPFGLIFAGALLTGCVSSVVVESDFPSPLVSTLPVTMGVVFDEELRNYIHVEELPQSSAWTIDIGDANVAMLEPLLDAMFMQTQQVNAVPVADPLAGRLDGVLHARLDKFEFDVPFTQQDQFAEVWVQYVLTLYNPDGSVVTEWPVNGYGKAEIIDEAEDSVHRAAVVALREVGAAISTRFAEHPDIRLWLEENEHETALSAGRGQ